MATTVKMRCVWVKSCHAAYTAKDKHAMPCRGFNVFFRNIEEQEGPQWGVAEMNLTVLHECHFVPGQEYEFEV